MTTKVFVRNNPHARIPSTYQDGIVLDFLPDIAQSTIATNLHRIIELVGEPTQAGIDIALLGASVYVADKKTSRRWTFDRWTRDFTVQMPVSNTECWQQSSPILTEALSFLTGDHWNFEWRQEYNKFWRVRPQKSQEFDAVCLFSGGLDSLAGAIDLLEEPSRPRVILLGHYDSLQTSPIQAQLATVLINHYGEERVKLLQIMVRPAVRGSQEYPLPAYRETTTRSRSLVFLGLGLATASAIGSTVPLYIPENGFIALNVPLTNARLGTCSTRTTHPYFLNQLRILANNIGLTNPIMNPFENRTKGELLRESKNPRLLQELARQSVSCAHPEVGRYEQSGYGNCGYCYPCLIRRASLHAIGLDNSSDYKRDVCSDTDLLDRHRVRGRDARAVFAALNRLEDLSGAVLFEPLMSGPIADGLSLNQFLRVYRQGMSELLKLFQDKATPEVHQIIGL